MKKHTAAFIMTAVVFSLCMHALSAFYYSRTAGLGRFITMRKAMEKNARLAAAVVPSFMEFRQSPSVAVLALPSCGPNLAPVPGSFDFLVMYSGSGSPVLSLYPSQASARKHRSLRFSGLKGTKYGVSGNLFSFRCLSGGRPFARSFCMTPGVMLLPQDAEAPAP